MFELRDGSEPRQFWCWWLYQLPRGPISAAERRDGVRKLHYWPLSAERRLYRVPELCRGKLLCLDWPQRGLWTMRCGLVLSDRGDRVHDLCGRNLRAD
jgi:hypothetical protein